MKPLQTGLRRLRAQVVITTYREFYYFSLAPDEALIDVLTDLRHWAENLGIDFTQALEHATSHFEAEAQP